MCIEDRGDIQVFVMEECFVFIVGCDFCVNENWNEGFQGSREGKVFVNALSVFFR